MTVNPTLFVDWLGLMLGLSALPLSLWALTSGAKLRRQIKELRAEVQRQNTALLALHGAMKVISEDVIAHGQAHSSVRRALDNLVDQHTELRLRDVDGGLYPQAIQMIQSGRRRDEVRKLCGLTESEVDLLFSLHGQGVATGAGFRSTSQS